MFRKFVFSISFVLVLGVAVSVKALEPFSILPSQDVAVCNDTNIGPDGAERGSGMHIRDIPSRRRVAIVVYDIAELAGRPVKDAVFNNYGHDTGPVAVYGIIEEMDDDIDETTITWNTAPGVQNDPTPPLDDPVALDFADLTGVLLRFDAPERGVRESTEPNQALDDFINSDTDGHIAFLFAPGAEAANAILRTKELEGGGSLLEGMSVPPPEALLPNPEDGAVDVSRDVVLSWRPGLFAAKHNVYFGTDANNVGEASPTDQRSVLVSQNQDGLSYDPAGDLVLGQTYYWRVDEVNEANPDGPWKGNLWSFTVANFVVVEDFEGDYNDYPPNEVWNTWIDGYGDPTNGSTAGYPDPDFNAGEHYLEGEIVNNGNWSMPLFYNNVAGISEVVRTFDSPMNWTLPADELASLGLWFEGDPANAAAALYMAVEDSAGNIKVVSNYDPAAVQVDGWQDMNVAFEELSDAGVNLSAVKKFYVGLGNKANPQPGSGEGHIFIDDIRVYQRRCVPSVAKPDYDLNHDCIVNQADLDLLMTEYGRSEVTPEEVSEVYREAESADSISAPMLIYDDPQASGGRYITVEPGNGSGTEPPATGVARYNITVNGGAYVIAARTIAPTGNDDSFWLNIDGATTQTNNDAASGWIRWVLPNTSDWTWGTVQSMDDGNATVQFTMNAGSYTIEIGYREDGALLDNLILVNDVNFDVGILAPLQYDLNGDGTVDDADVALMMEQWLDEILWP